MAPQPQHRTTTPLAVAANSRETNNFRGIGSNSSSGVVRSSGIANRSSSTVSANITARASARIRQRATVATTATPSIASSKPTNTIEEKIPFESKAITMSTVTSAPLLSKSSSETIVTDNTTNGGNAVNIVYNDEIISESNRRSSENPPSETNSTQRTTSQRFVTTAHIPKVAWEDETFNEKDNLHNKIGRKATTDQVLNRPENYGGDTVPGRIGAAGLRTTLRSTIQQNNLNVNRADKLNKVQQYESSIDRENSMKSINDARNSVVLSKKINQSTKLTADIINEVEDEDYVEKGEDDTGNEIIQTIEDIEKELEYDPSLIDASCLSNHSDIMIKSHFACRTIQYTGRTSEMVQTEPSLAFTGLSLGEINEIFRLNIVNPQHQHYETSSNNYDIQYDEWTPRNSNDMLRYGDRIVLSMPNKQNDIQRIHKNSNQSLESGKVSISDYRFQLLGISRTTTDENKPIASVHVDLCRSKQDLLTLSQNPAYQWTVLRYNPKIPVLIGRTAVRTKGKHVSKQHVQAGNPILLRHVESGGILSCCYDSDKHTYCLRILYDSYDSNRVRHAAIPTSGTTDSVTLLTRLENSNLLIASPEEVFYISLSTTPPTPLWMSKTRQLYQGEDFLSSFLFHEYLPGHTPHRDFLNDDASNVLSNVYKVLQEERNTDLQTLTGQEKVLVDEIIGSFLGIEGEFVKVSRTTTSGNLLLPFEFKLQNRSGEELVCFDRIFSNLVEEILHLPTSFIRVRHFVATHYPGYEYGCAMQAMCESLDYLLQNYLNSTVAAVEKQQRQCFEQKQHMTLRSLLNCIKNALHEMNVLEQACTETYKKKGGALINSLAKLKTHVYRGDLAAEKVLHQLLHAASTPYIRQLTCWLVRGELIDHHHEFMVTLRPKTSEEEKEMTGIVVTSWEREYCLVPDNILEDFFATKLTVEQVLATGRYWNALRACNDSRSDMSVAIDEIPFQETINYTSSVATISSYVHNLYIAASRALLQLLKFDYDIIGSLRLMKRYFLLEHGDFFVNFLDVAESELQKDLSQVSRGRVQHWLSVAVQATERGAEMAERILFSPTTVSEGVQYTHEMSNNSLPKRLTTPSRLRCLFSTLSLTEYLDQIHASTGGIDTNDPWTPLRHTYSTGKLNTSRITEGLSGLEAFVLEFGDIPFPVSLVLSTRALEEYQLLFRHLFFAKHVERRLVSIWQDHQFMKELQSLRGTMGQTFLLRQRMLHFLQNLIYYMMFEVIEPNWIELEEMIQQSNSYGSAKHDQTVDDILQVHSQFLQRTLDACLLTNRTLIRALTKLMRTCLLFTEQMKRFLKATKIEDDRINVADEMQKVVQRNINDRRSSIDLSFNDSTDTSRKMLRSSIQKAKKEREHRVKRQTMRVQREVSSESYQKMVRRFEEVFSDNLREFMTLLSHSDDSFHTHKVNLCIRLDYNGYVGRTLT